MAKKKKSEETVDGAEEKIDDQDDGLGDLIKKFGKETFVNAKSIVDSKSVVIPVSPAIDMVLGGGIKEGTFVVTTGPPKVGKTSMCLDFAATAQQSQYDSPEWGPRHIYFIGVEERLRDRDITGIQHLDPNRVTVIKSSPGNLLSGEQYIDISEQLINTRPGCIFIIDSFSALCTAGERAANIADRYRADSPLLLAKFCRRIANVIPVNKSIVMGITHMIANQGGAGMSPWSEASGRKVQYQSDVKLKASHCEAWKVGETQIGQDVHWTCQWSALGPPGGKCISKFRYGFGIDKQAELVEMAVNFGLITKSGAWYRFADGTQAQGLEKTRDRLVSDTQLYNDLYSQIRTMLGYN